MICSPCQSEAPDDASFCPKCGAPIAAASRIILPPNYQAAPAPPVKPATRPKPPEGFMVVHF